MSKKQSVSGNQIENAYRKALEAYSDRENVTGVDVGFKYVGEEATNQTAIPHPREAEAQPFRAGER